MRQAILGNYLIGLREGLEASLVVTVLVAFLVRSARRDRLPMVWAGVAAAVGLSVGFGALLTFVAQDLLDEDGRELFEGVVSLLAVVFVTWMIFWMRRTARKLSGDLRAKLQDALRLGAVAVAAMAFFAVAREGLETAMLFYAAAQGATTSGGPLVGISLGVLTAVALGILLYRSAVRINLTRFFTWTGLLLILVAAGIVKTAVHALQEGGILPGEHSYAFNIGGWFHPDAWYAALLGGMFNVTPRPSVLEVAGWLAYAVPVLVVFLWPARRVPAPRPAPVAPAAGTPAVAGTDSGQEPTGTGRPGTQVDTGEPGTAGGAGEGTVVGDGVPARYTPDAAAADAEPSRDRVDTRVQG